jgi:hypothetical protein
MTLAAISVGQNDQTGDIGVISPPKLTLLAIARKRSDAHHGLSQGLCKVN